MPGVTSIMAGMAFVKITTDNSELVKGLKSAQGKLAAFRDSVKSLDREMAVMAATVGPAMLMSLRTFSDFDDQMRQTKAVTGATAEEFKKLSQVAGKLGDETSFTGAQVAAGKAALGRMGFSTKEIEGAIKPVMDLSRATGTDLAAAAEIAANNMRVFEMRADEMNTAADLMAATANGSAQTLTDLGEALKMAGPHAKRAGADLKETCAALGILANMGIKGSLAGTALGKSYKRLADPKVIAYLDNFNIKTTDGNGNLRRMRDILVDISKVMATMGTAEQINFAEKVFDARGSLGGGTLSVNVKAIDDFVKKLDAAAGYASKTAQEMDEGIGGTLRRISSAAEGFSRTMGQMIGEAFKPILEFSTGLILALRDLVNAFPMLTKGFVLVAGVASALGAAMFAVSAAGKLIGSVVGNVKSLVAAFSGSAAAQAQAEKMKELAADTATTRRIAIENKRHMIEMQNSAKEAAAVAAAEKKKLAAAEERVRQENAYNEKVRYAYALQNGGSSKGYKPDPQVVAAEKALEDQKRAVEQTTAAYNTSRAAASQAAKAYDESKQTAIAAARAQADYAAATTSAWSETKRLVAIETEKKAALAQSAAAQKAAMNIGPLTQEQANHYALMSQSAQQAFSTAQQAADKAALKICQSLGLTGTAADIAGVKILAMNNVAAGHAGLAALSGALHKVKAAVIAFITAADKWQFTTLKNINLTKILTAVKLSLGKAFSLSAAQAAATKTVFAALGIVTKGLTAAALGAKAAVLALWAAMKAHPIVAVVAAIAMLTAAIAALCIQIEKYQESQMLDFADKYRARQDKVIQADEIRAKRLLQLAGKQQLNNEEMKTAEECLSSLRKYGDDLGITLDKQTGQLNVAAGAWENLQKAMDAKKISNIDRVIKQEEQNIAELRGELQRFGSDDLFLRNKDGSLVKNMSKEDQEARIKAIEQELDRRMEKIAALKEEQRLIKNPPKVKDEVEKEIQHQEELSKEVEKAQKAQAAAEEKLARMSRTDLENKIHDLQRERDEYKKNIQVQLDYEKGQRNQDKEKIRRLEEKLAGADKAYQVQIDKAKKEQQESFERDLKAMREDYERAQAELERSRQQRKEDRQIDEAAKKSPDSAVKMIDAMLLDLAKQIEESKKKVQAALEKAAKPDKKGNVSKEAQQELKTARDELSRQQSRQDSLQQKKDQLETSRLEQGKRNQRDYGDKIARAEQEEAKKKATSDLDANIQKALKADLQSGLALIKTVISNFAAAADSAKKAYEAAYAEAMKDGTINEDEQRNLDALFKKYSEASGLKQQYQERLKEIQKNPTKDVKALASFDASTLQNLFDRSGRAAETREERIAKATEETAKNTKKLTQGGGLLVG